MSKASISNLGSLKYERRIMDSGLRLRLPFYVVNSKVIILRMGPREINNRKPKYHKRDGDKRRYVHYSTFMRRCLMLTSTCRLLYVLCQFNIIQITPYAHVSVELPYIP